MKVHEAAAAVGVSTATLRKWEREQLLAVPRTRGGYRDYNPDHIRRARQILELSRRGFPLKTVRDLLGAAPRGGPLAGPAPELGPALRELRRRKGHSLVRAARAAGISPSHLSQLETGRYSPSIACLQRLGAVYDVTLLEFLTIGQPAGARLVRESERRSVPVASEHITMEALAKGDTAIEALIVRVQPGGGCLDAHGHPGGEFLYVLSGMLEVVVDEGQPSILQAGDSLAFASSHLHRWQALGQDAAALLWVHTKDTQETKGLMDS